MGNKPSGIQKHAQKLNNFRTLSGGNGDFSIMTYNILADSFVSKSGYYYVEHSDYLTNNYRSKLIMSDIEKLNADIICLQEVEHQMYSTIQKEYKASQYVPRKGAPDGICTVYKSDKFQLMEETVVDLDDCFQYFGVEQECQKGCQTQILHFKHLHTEREILVSNTHTHWNPWDDIIKYGQIAYMLSMVEQKKQMLGNIPVILVGDWNSRPESTCYQLCKHSKPVTEESLQIEFKIESNKKMFQKRLELLPIYTEIFNKVQKSNQYQSAYQGYIQNDESIRYIHGDAHPKATNYKLNFKDTLDYIFYDPEYLCATKILEIDEELYQSEGANQSLIKRLFQIKQSKRSVDRLGAVPNSFHPSDHIPLWAQFQLK